MTRRIVAMSFSSKPRAYGVVVLAVCIALGLLVKPLAGVAAGQSAQEAEGARLLKGSIDMHFHMDPPGPNSIPGNEQADIAKVRIAHARGLRALVIKDHNQPTSGVVYLLRLEVPNFLMYGGIVLNRPNGGINPAAVEFMATQIRGAPGKVVWMPAFDTESEVKASTQPNRPFVSVTRAGQVLPEVKEVISDQGSTGKGGLDAGFRHGERGEGLDATQSAVRERDASRPSAARSEGSDLRSGEHRERWSGCRLSTRRAR